MKTIKLFNFFNFFLFWTNFNKIIRKFTFITSFFIWRSSCFFCFFSRSTKFVFELMTNVSFFRFFRFFRRLLRFLRCRSRSFFRRFFLLSLRWFFKRFSFRFFRFLSRFLFRENLLKRSFTSSWKFRFFFLLLRKLFVWNFNFYNIPLQFRINKIVFDEFFFVISIRNSTMTKFLNLFIIWKLIYFIYFDK